MQAFHTLGLVALTGVLLIFLQTILVPFVLAVFLGYLVTIGYIWDAGLLSYLWDGAAASVAVADAGAAAAAAS